MHLPSAPRLTELTKVVWRDLGFRFERINSWVYDPEFGWLEFCYTPYTSFWTCEKFLKKYVRGYRNPQTGVSLSPVKVSPR